MINSTNPDTANRLEEVNRQSATTDLSNLRAGVVYWAPKDGFSSGISHGLEYLQCQVINFMWNENLPSHLDIVFVWGPLGSLVPLAKQLLAYPRSQRPALVFLMTEQLPNPGLPEWFRYWIGKARSRIERLAYTQPAEGVWKPNRWLRPLITKAYRFRYYGDLYWLHQQGLLPVIWVTSLWTAEFLRARGFDPLVPPPSYNPDHGRDLGLERDISVLWIGKPGSGRRKQLLTRVRAELRERGVEILMIDGEENPYVFGEERTVLLNRTKIALNLLREWWDDNSARYYLAAPNKVLVVSEPTLPHTPFLPEVHRIEAPIEQMADTICYYLSHDEERERIVNQAYELVTGLSGVEGLLQILERAIIVRNNTRATSC